VDPMASEAGKKIHSLQKTYGYVRKCSDFEKIKKLKKFMEIRIFSKVRKKSKNHFND